MYSVNSTEVVNCLWANPLDSSCPPGTIRAVGPGSENGLTRRGRESALEREKRGMILPLSRGTFSILCRLLRPIQNESEYSVRKEHKTRFHNETMHFSQKGSSLTRFICNR